MMQPTQSYLKVPYDLRPAKQVERRMIIDALQVLSIVGFDIPKYQYTGLGSVYFVDFILFHKFLGIQKLWSVEIDRKIEKRVQFNKPFSCIDIKIDSIGNVIPQLSRKRKHILWLDYDSVIRSEHLQDVWLAAVQLPPGSILLVTVDVERPLGSDDPEEWRQYFQAEASEYSATFDKKAFAGSNLPTLNRDLLASAIQSGLSARELQFYSLFSFLYADGHEMLTLGGMIGGPEERVLIERSGLTERTGPVYIRSNLKQKPYRILVPRLTRKERLYLDRAMPCPAGWKSKDFELPPEFVSVYTEIYRFLPTYAELLL